MFRTASDIIGFTTGGTESVQIGSFGVAADTLTNKTSSADVTIDAAGGIILDADDAGTISLKDGGTRYGVFAKSSNNFDIQSTISDGDIVFKGNDGGSGITALTLDMSQAGEADFNSALKVGNQIVAHQTNRGVLEYNSNITRLRSYGASAGTGELRFQTGGGGGSADTLAMIIDNNQNVGIGTSSPTDTGGFGRALDVSSSTGAALYLRDAGDSTFAAISMFNTNLSINSKASSGNIIFYSNDSEKVRIDGSGRVGIGGTPNTNWRNDIADQEVLMLGTEATLFSDGGVTTELWNNAYVDNSDVFKNISTRGASRYYQYQGNHKWFTAVSASAGSTITSELQTTPKMTLFASGAFQLQTANQASALQTDYSGDDIIFGSSAAGNSNAYFGNLHSSANFFYAANNTSTTSTPPVFINRQNNDGLLIIFRQGNADEGSIEVSGSTVSLNGFSGKHESSGISTSVQVGTVVSTIDELDVYPNTQPDIKTGEEAPHPKAGQPRADHAKVKVSDTVGDKRVYGVVNKLTPENKVMVTSLGIGSVLVTGACDGGDLLESNGDGTAKVQSDDIIRSKTIGKVTIGNSDTGVKLVSSVMYCG